MKALVAFYSRTGTTRKVAEAISTILESDIEEIVDTKNRAGAIGYLRSSIEGLLKRTTVIKETETDPALYDLAVVGTPIQVQAMSSPVRTYLTQNKERFRKVAFFCTQDGSGSKRAFKEMEKICGKKPLGLLELRTREVASGEHFEKVETFIHDLRRHLIEESSNRI